MLSFILTIILLNSQAFGALDLCPKVISVEVACQKSPYLDSLQLVRHNASYFLNEDISRLPKKGDQEAGIQRCMYRLQDDTSWSSTYKISGTIYKDISDYVLLKDRLEEPSNPLRDRKYVITLMQPFLELHYKKDSTEFGPTTHILFTGLEYLMSRDQMVQKENHDQSEIVAAIQVNFSNPQTTEDDFVVTGSDCRVKIQEQ